MKLTLFYILEAELDVTAKNILGFYRQNLFCVEYFQIRKYQPHSNLYFYEWMISMIKVVWAHMAVCRVLWFDIWQHSSLKKVKRKIKVMKGDCSFSNWSLSLYHRRLIKTFTIVSLLKALSAENASDWLICFCLSVNGTHKDHWSDCYEIAWMDSVRQQEDLIKFWCGSGSRGQISGKQIPFCSIVKLNEISQKQSGIFR